MMLGGGGARSGMRSDVGRLQGTDKVSKRADWLNLNVFNPLGQAIEQSAVEAVGQLEMSTAMDLFADLEAKARTNGIKNPTNYLTAAARRELTGEGRGMKRSAGSPR